MRILVVAAHPDDETIGCGALLGREPDAQVIHLTDGAPRDPELVPERWRGDRDGYRKMRRLEVEGALALAKVPAHAIRCLGVADQEATFALVELAHRVAELLLRLRPVLVITHPYEGGHPDHDAAAFVTYGALRLARMAWGFAPLAAEMTSYHGAPGRLVTGSFLGEDGALEELGQLCREDRARKMRMLACFRSQRETLAPFSPARERFRPTPRYDFSEPPHPGALYYEQLGWRMKGQSWRELAAAAEGHLFPGLPPC
jgi:LmbE family N-acetylglucosaminyl deacetylase